MGKLDIGKQDGFVELPIGEVMRADLTHNEFRTSAIYLNARTTHTSDGTADYQFSAGDFQGKRWRARLSFFNQLLVHLDLVANLYPKGQWSQTHFDLNVESATKRFHDELLLKMLGAPELEDNLEVIRAYELGNDHINLANRAIWRFPWGSISSFHDFSGRKTEIRVVYATRHQQKMSRFVKRLKK